MYHSPERVGFLNKTKKWPRRLAATVAGSSLTIGSVVALDGWAGKRLWGRTENQFTGIDPDAQEQVLSMGGLGVTCGKTLADDAQKFLPGAAGYVTYSNEGFSLAQLAAGFSRQASEIKLLHLNLHSMGGPVGLETVRTAEARNIQLGSIFLNCSPFNNDDAYLGRYTNLLEVIRWPVGPGSKLLFSLSRSLLEHTSTSDAWRQAKFDAVNGCSPHLFLSQLGTLRRTNLKANQEEYKPLIGPETKVFYCRPEDPQRDTVVNTLQASERFANFFDGLGIPYAEVLVPDVGHAESGPTADFLGKTSLLGCKQNNCGN